VSAQDRPAPRVGAFQEAIRYWRSRVPRREQDIDRLTEENQATAFTLAGVAQLDLVTDVWQALDRAIAQGTTFETFKQQVQESLFSAWGGEKPYRVETIFRTNVQTAYAAGRWEQMQDEEVVDIRPFSRFLAVLDTRTTVLICRPLADTVLLSDDPWWRSHWPPLHFSCRSTVLPLTREQASEVGMSRKRPAVAAQTGFGLTPDQGAYIPERPTAPAQLVQALKTR
jgi:SPP1 gp7 family putative phage head morphogenesis protein